MPTWFEYEARAEEIDEEILDDYILYKRNKKKKEEQKNVPN